MTRLRRFRPSRKEQIFIASNGASLDAPLLRLRGSGRGLVEFRQEQTEGRGLFGEVPEYGRVWCGSSFVSSSAGRGVEWGGTRVGSW